MSECDDKKLCERTGRNMTKPERRQEWIDVAKFLAILAVVIDHSGGILYYNDNIAYASFFNVCVFILTMGITTFWSFQKNNKGIQDVICGKCLRIIGPYLTATFIYCIVIYRSFSLETFLMHVIHFNASPPFYYVLLYIQLILISPVLNRVLSVSSKKKNGWLIEMLTFFAVILVSSLTTNYTNILDVSCGGGKLFGGTYLILFYLGMWFGKYCARITLKPAVALSGSIVSLLLSVRWWLFFSNDRMRLDRLLPLSLGSGYNPPSISLIVYAVLITSTVFFAGQIPMSFFGGIYKRVFSGMAYFGKHTLYVFLYHKLLLDFLYRIDGHTTGALLDNIWFKRVAYIVGILFISLLIETLLKKTGCFIRTSYKNTIKT